MGRLAKPQVSISIFRCDSASTGALPFFSVLDTVSGDVTISTLTPIPVKPIRVSLVGTAKTFVDRLSSVPHISGSPDVTFTFLRMQESIDIDLIPDEYLSKSGQGYRFPFSFILPERVSRGSCDHACREMVREAHRRLPPSIGHDFGPDADIFYPDYVCISYAILASVELTESDYWGSSSRLESSHTICVRPTYLNDLRLIPESDRKNSKFHDKVNIRTLGGRKRGRLIMETQPYSTLYLPGPAFINVNLQYIPESDSYKPPNLREVKFKLTGMTFFATTPRETFPTKQDLQQELTAALFSRSIPLNSRTISPGKWQRHSLSTGGHFYNMALTVPITVPERVSLVPTFHSCFVSRTYRLRMFIPVSATSTLSLKVPLQINKEGCGVPPYSPALEAPDYSDEGFPPATSSYLPTSPISGASICEGEI